MTLKVRRKPSEVTLTACPYCGESLAGTNVPTHLCKCEAVR